MDFGELQNRLLQTLRTRLQNGELTERRLAHLTGISQPHVHNVLKGVRILSPRAADQILRRLDLNLLDLVFHEELARGFCLVCSPGGLYVEVPVLAGWLGPGLPLPREPSKVERYPFPRSYITSIENAVVARLAPDMRMAGLLWENDLVLLDQSPGSRLRLDHAALYEVSRQGEGLVRRLRLEADCLLLVTCPLPGQPDQLEAIPLEGCHLLDVVKARVAWIGRCLPPR